MIAWFARLFRRRPAPPPIASGARPQVSRETALKVMALSIARTTYGA